MGVVNGGGEGGRGGEWGLGRRKGEGEGGWTFQDVGEGDVVVEGGLEEGCGGVEVGWDFWGGILGVAARYGFR